MPQHGRQRVQARCQLLESNRRAAAMQAALRAGKGRLRPNDAAYRNASTISGRHSGRCHRESLLAVRPFGGSVEHRRAEGLPSRQLPCRMRSCRSQLLFACRSQWPLRRARLFVRRSRPPTSSACPYPAGRSIDGTLLARRRWTRRARSP